MSTFEEEKERNKRKDYAYQFYLKKGLRPVEAAAIVGNLDIESAGFRPDVIAGTNKNKDHDSEGVAQWRLERLDKLKSKYKNYKSLDSQLNFVLDELSTTHKGAYDKMKKASSVEEATSAFTWDYERPNKQKAHFNKRLKSAAELLGQEVDPNFTQGAFEDDIDYSIDTNVSVVAKPLNLESSTTEYKEPEEPKEVQEAKQEIAKKSFVEDVSMILSQAPSNEIVPQQQPEQQFASDDMQDPYNYININEGQEEFQKGGEIIRDNRGQWAHPGQITQIDSSDITMKGVNYPVLGIDNLGNQQMMYPNQEYKFEGNVVTEYPQIQKIKKGLNRFK